MQAVRKMMNPWIFALLALVALPWASGQDASTTLQTIAQMPQCARNCLGGVIFKSQCELTNQTCMCESPILRQKMTACVTLNCTIREALSTMNLTAVGCNAPVRDRTQKYITISNVFGTVSAVFVIQRFAYKIWAKIELGRDDWMTLITIVVGVPSTVINAYGVTANGLGRDIWTLQPANITEFIRYFFIQEIIYFSEVALLKLSLLFFYVRIFPGRWVRRLLWGTFVVCALFGTSFAMVAIFQCTPVHYYWVKWDGEHEGKCLDINTIAWSNAGISIALDAWMLAIPLWQLRSLNLDWRRKVGVALMFCVGTFITVVSILRLRSLVKFGSETLNPTWDFVEIGMWSTVEINVGIICVCMPSFRLLLVRLFPKLKGTTQRYYARYASNANRSTASKRVSCPPMGNSTASHVDRSRHNADIESNRIACHKTYTVEYGDNDEVQLVYMKDHDMKSARSDVS